MRQLKLWLLLPVLVLFAVSPVTAVGVAADGNPTLKYARGFQIETIGTAKLLTVKPNWKAQDTALRYLLVPRGKPVPEHHPPAQVVFVPVKRVVSLATPHLGYMDAAGQIDRLVGLASFKLVNTPSVRRRIDSGALKETGQFTNLRLEILLNLAPDLILTSASGSVHDVHAKLLEVGLPTVLMIDHMEAHPLGRLEWIKFIAHFFDTRAHAEKLFNEVEVRYRQLAAQAAKAAPKPKVITGVPFQGQWWIAKGDSFAARFIRDAGGNYLWSDVPGVGSLPMDIEAVYARSLPADIWLNTGTWQSLSEARKTAPRLTAISALKQGRLYNNNKRLNPWGGNDYWESGMLRPDRILADLISILHPEVLPTHKLVYYRRLVEK